GLLAGDVRLRGRVGTRAARLRGQARARGRAPRALRPRARVPRAARPLRRPAALPAHAVVHARPGRARASLLRDGAPPRRGADPGSTRRRPFDDAERAALGPQVARALARLHAIDWRARGFQFLGAPRPGREAAERELARWEERIRRSGLPVSPPLAEALLWCRRHAPATDAITLVHGDYRL